MEGDSPSFSGKVAVGKVCLIARIWVYGLTKLKSWFHDCEEKGGICPACDDSRWTLGCAQSIS